MTALRDPGPDLPAGRPGVAAAAGATTRWRGDLAIAALGLLVLALWDASGLDLAAMRLFGDARGFAARDAWWLAHVGHDGLRGLGWAALAMLLANAVRPWTRALDARQRWAWLGLTLVGAALAPLLKQASLTSCPWELAEFGGVAAHVSHWRPAWPTAARVTVFLPATPARRSRC